MSEDDLKAYFKRKKRWTEGEKKVLLRGLKKYGSKSVDKIKILLPNKSKNSILQMIRKYQAIADLGKKEVNSPIDIWIRSGIFEADDTLLSQALLFIYLFEDNPSPTETAGFDLQKAYKFLYETMHGHLNTNLPRKTAELFKQLILSVDKDIWPANEYSTTDYLISKLCIVEAEKCYKRKREEEEEEE